MGVETQIQDGTQGVSKCSRDRCGQPIMQPRVYMQPDSRRPYVIGHSSAHHLALKHKCSSRGDGQERGGGGIKSVHAVTPLAWARSVYLNCC